MALYRITAIEARRSSAGSSQSRGTWALLVKEASQLNNLKGFWENGVNSHSISRSHTFRSNGTIPDLRLARSIGGSASPLQLKGAKLESHQTIPSASLYLSSQSCSRYQMEKSFHMPNSKRTAKCTTSQVPMKLSPP